MPTLSSNSYGKSEVRLTKVNRPASGSGGSGPHELQEITVNITLHGAFEKSYLAGDNSQIVATDTMKNSVYGLAKKNAFASIEAFGQILGEHFVTRNSQVDSASVFIRQHTWTRINNSPIAFEGSSQEERTATVITARGNSDLTTSFTAGLSGLLVLKTTGSEFHGFLRDEFTTLPEVKDRIVSTIINATWDYTKLPTDPNAAFTKARTAMLDVFAREHSLAVQQTLFQMGEAALAAVPEMDEITITLPNKHRIPFPLKNLNLEFNNDIFITTDEPYGDISGTISR